MRQLKYLALLQKYNNPPPITVESAYRGRDPDYFRLRCPQGNPRRCRGGKANPPARYRILREPWPAHRIAPGILTQQVVDDSVLFYPGNFELHDILIGPYSK